MYGFAFGYKKDFYKIHNLENAEIIKGKKYFFLYNKLKKYTEDKLFFETEKVCFLLDGIVFNKEELVRLIEGNDWEDACRIYAESDRIDLLLDNIRGNYCGVVYYKEEEKILAYTDLIGEKAIYYCKTNDDGVFIASHMGIMKELMVYYNEKMDVNKQACKEMLATSSFLHGNTFLKNVYRLNGGYCLIGKDGEYVPQRYHVFRNLPEWDYSLDECIEKTDKLFKQAIKRICDKNREYGYDMEADLSGGLDSRLATFGIFEEGVKNVLNICWCQSNRIDNIISKKIAKKLNNKYKIYKMDGGDFLKDVDRMTRITGGQIHYTSSTCANRVFSSLNLENIGMTVTGLLGELHNGYWTKGVEHTKPLYDTFYTKEITISIPDEYSDEYDNYEQMNLYELSGFTFMSSAFTRQQMVEVCSPFIDRDYLEFAYRIPLRWRKNDVFTLNWIAKKYPAAAMFIWQKNMKSIRATVDNKVYLPKFYWDFEKLGKRVINKVLRIMKIKYQVLMRDDMNPFEVWYMRNRSIKAFFERYYEEHIGLVKDSEIKDDIYKLMNTGKCYDAMLAINMLGIFNYYFNDVLVQ